MSQPRRPLMRFLALAALALTACVALIAARTPPTVPEVVEAFLKGTGIPGAVLAHGPANGAPSVVAFGVSDPNTGAQMQVDQAFRLASLTKPITAAALLARADAGKVDLDTPLAQQVAMPMPHDPRAADITPRHILSHRTGFDRNLSFDPVFAPEQLGQTREASCYDLAKTAWAHMPLDHAPGTTKAYSNIGMCLLTGLLGPDTQDALQGQADITIAGLAGPNWRQTGEGWRDIQTSAEEQRWLTGLGVAGGGVGRAEALWRFVSEPQPSLSEPQSAGATEDFYALGWRVWPGPDGRQLTHWGGLPGVFTAMFRFSDDEVVVVLFNAAPPNYAAGFDALYDNLCRARDLRCGPK